MSVTLCLFCCFIVILSVNNVRCQCIVLILACCIVTYWSMLMDLLIVNLFNYYNHLCYNYSFNLTCVMFLLFFFQLLQTAYFGYSVINDIFGSNLLPSEYNGVPNVPTLLRFRDFIAASIVFPTCMVNGHCCWCFLCLLDPPEFHQGLWCGKVIKSAM